MFVKTHVPQDDLIVQLIPVLVHASQILLSEYQHYIAGKAFSIEHKSDQSPVTQADLKVNAFLLEKLKEIHPIYPVISEENDFSARKNWSTCWMLDPLDGTKEFIHQRNQFTINLSLIENTKTIFSVIVVPCEQQMYLGYTHQLPYKYQYDKNIWWCYQPNLEKDITQSIQLGLSHSRHQQTYTDFIHVLQKKYNVLEQQAGSAYKFCMMLEDKVDMYPRFHPTSEWDTSAGQGLLESIGGGLIGLDGQPFRYNKRDTVLNSGFIAFKSVQMKEIAVYVLGQLDLKIRKD